MGRRLDAGGLGSQFRRVTAAESDAPSSRAPLRMGMVLAPTRSAFGGGEAEAALLRERLVRFCSALTDATGLPAEPREFDDYPSLLGAMAMGDLDLAWLPPIVAMRAAASGRTLPIALPVRRGVSTCSRRPARMTATRFESVIASA